VFAETNLLLKFAISAHHSVVILAVIAAADHFHAVSDAVVYGAAVRHLNTDHQHHNNDCNCNNYY